MRAQPSTNNRNSGTIVILSGIVAGETAARRLSHNRTSRFLTKTRVSHRNRVDSLDTYPTNPGVEWAPSPKCQQVNLGASPFCVAFPQIYSASTLSSAKCRTRSHFVASAAQVLPDSLLLSVCFLMSKRVLRRILLCSVPCVDRCLMSRAWHVFNAVAHGCAGSQP